MSVTTRAYFSGGWEVDIRFRLPDGTVVRERTRSLLPSRSAAQRWGQARERVLLLKGKPTDHEKEVAQVVTLKEFAPRFIDGYARANRQKPSGIAWKQTILRAHLIPRFGQLPLDRITTQDVQRLKAELVGKAPKTVNNVLTVLNVVLKTAISWGVIDRVPCVIRLVKTTTPTAHFHDFSAYESLVKAARADGTSATLIVLLGGEAGLRCGEIMALEWGDVDLANRQLTVAKSDWKGQITAPKGGRLRRVPLTLRLAGALAATRRSRNQRVVVNDAGRSLTLKMVECVMHRVAAAAGVRGGVHILRHTFCSHLAAKGVSLRAVQELAGHQDLATTQRYMHLSPAALEDAIRVLDGPRTDPWRNGGGGRNGAEQAQ